MHERENALNQWLAQTLKSSQFQLLPLSGDASFRKYFRLKHQANQMVVMDAPPGKENLQAFIHVANLLTQSEILVPEIIAQDQQQGFLLLSDFGDNLLLSALNPETVDHYYGQAIATMVQMQACPIETAGLPEFDKDFMLQEMHMCSEWFFQAYLGLVFTIEEQQIIDHTMHWLADEIAKQPQVFIHRDYHSRNLMLVSEQALGVIDFQDAVRGPLTYDLVSLLKDCYISWPRAKVLAWVASFYQQSSLAQSYSLAEFIRAFDLCGLQRHIKVLGVFCRLKLRDNKDGYIKDLPLTLRYTLECAQSYPELHPFFELLRQRVHLS